MAPPEEVIRAPPHARGSLRETRGARGSAGADGAAVAAPSSTRRAKRRRQARTTSRRAGARKWKHACSAGGYHNEVTRNGWNGPTDEHRPGSPRTPPERGSTRAAVAAPRLRRPPPRASGERPRVPRHRQGFPWAAPRARGWTRPPRRGRVPASGCPARAGMDPRTPRRRRRWLPRTRGDPPVMSERAAGSASRAPRARGRTRRTHVEASAPASSPTTRQTLVASEPNSVSAPVDRDAAGANSNRGRTTRKGSGQSQGKREPMTKETTASQRAAVEGVRV